MQASHIRWFDVSPGNLKGGSFENLTERFRGNGVAALLTHLESLDGTVIILLSPLSSVFCGSFMHDALYWHDRSRIDWGSNLDRNRAYAQELRRAKIRKADPQAMLFGNFDRECGSKARSVPSLSVGVGYLEIYRVISYGFEKAHEMAVRRYLDRKFDQLGQWAFVPVPEGEAIGGYFPGGYSFDYWLMTWRHPTYGLDDDGSSHAMATRVLAELKRSTERLEAGLAFDVPEISICQIKRPLNVTCPIERAQPLTAEVLSYRSRLVHLLGHPGYFGPVTEQLPELRGSWPQLANGKSFAYDPICELECYLAEMLDRFPVLGETPFA